MIAVVLDQVPDETPPTSGGGGGGGSPTGGGPAVGVLDQVEPVYTTHIVERYYWRWEDEPNGDPQFLGQKKLGTWLFVPFPYDVTVRPIHWYMITTTEHGIDNANDIRRAKQGTYPQAPTFTSAAFDTGGLDIDMVFHKNSPGTGNIQVEYKKVLDTSWNTHATSFSHSATSGSITIAQEATAQTYLLRLKQVGYENYSRTLEVTVTGSGGGNSPPTFSTATYDSANSEVDMTFAKNGSGTGNLQFEYKKTADSTWLTHVTEFAHNITSGSILITEEATAQSWDIRMKQSGVSGYSTTKTVTVDAAPSGSPPTLLQIDSIDLVDTCEWEYDFSWTAGSGSGNYTFEYKIGSGSWIVQTTSIVGTNFSTTVFGIPTSSRTFHWRVKQNDVVGYTNEVADTVSRCFD